MSFHKIKSYAKINLILNITGKDSLLHKIESIIMFTALHDEIFIKAIKSDNHNISFFGKFSPGINMNNTVTNLLNILAVMAIPGILSPSSLTAMTVNRDLFVMVLLTLALVAIVGLASLRQKSETPSLGRPVGLLLLLSYGFYYTLIF